jgi:Kef-type K+ transport system membrane component KefB
MHLTVTELFFLAMFIIYVLPFLAWRLAGRPNWAPLVVIQIVAGILLGPGVMGATLPGLYDAIFTPPVIAVLNGIGWLAVMFFIFIAGLELDPRSALSEWRETGTVAGAALLVPMAVGALAAFIIIQSPGWMGEEGSRLQVILGIGMACAVTALPVLLVFLQETGLLRTPMGQRVLRYASLDDVAIWAVLAIILLDWDRVLRQGSFLVFFAVASIGIRHLMPRLGDMRDRWYVAMGWLFAAGLAADWSGLHYTVGAFLAGAVLDSSWLGRDRIDRFRASILLTVMPVFFLSTGLRTDWEAAGLLGIVAVTALLVVASVGGKLVGVRLAGARLGWRAGEAGIIGWLLQTKGLIEIIFASILLDHGIISAQTFTALLLMAVTSTMLTLPFVNPRLVPLRASGYLPPAPPPDRDA